jgi:predicted TIM-barrel fold metal-dependent hydrolase
MTNAIVDTHAHIISADKRRYPQSPLGGVQSDWSLARPVTWERLKELMRDAGIDSVVLVQASTVYGHDNSYLADTLERDRGRAVGVASIGLTDADVLTQIDHWTAKVGIAGVRAFVTGSTAKQALRLNDDRAMAAWAALAQRRIPVAMNIDEASFADLLGVLTRFPDLVVALDHAGRVDFASGPPYLPGRGLEQFAEFAGVYLKLSTRTLRQAQASAGGSRGLVNELVARFGSHRITWGSNFPATDGDLGSMVALLLDSVEELSETDAANVCAGSALRLYPALLELGPTADTAR